MDSHTTGPGFKTRWVRYTFYRASDWLPPYHHHKFERSLVCVEGREGFPGRVLPKTLQAGIVVIWPQIFKSDIKHKQTNPSLFPRSSDLCSEAVVDAVLKTCIFIQCSYLMPLCVAIWIGIVKKPVAPKHWKEGCRLVITWLYLLWLLACSFWLVVFNVPSTARSFRDGTPIYCPLRRTWSSINTPFRPGIEPRAVAWQSITLPLCYASSLCMF